MSELAFERLRLAVDRLEAVALCQARLDHAVLYEDFEKEQAARKDLENARKELTAGVLNNKAGDTAVLPAVEGVYPLEMEE